MEEGQRGEEAIHSPFRNSSSTGQVYLNCIVQQALSQIAIPRYQRGWEMSSLFWAAGLQLKFLLLRKDGRTDIRRYVAIFATERLWGFVSA